MTTRPATAEDAEKVWALYRETGFLYPAKLEALGGQEAHALDTLRRLLTLDSEIYRVAMVEDEEGALQSVCTAGRFSDTQVWVMHLASRHNRGALVRAMVRGCNSAITSDAGSVTYTYRHNNRSIRRLFETRCGSAVPSIEQSTYAYYSIDDDTSARVFEQPRPQGCVAIRSTDEHDLDAALAGLRNDPSQYIALAANGPLDGHGIAQVAARLAGAQLIRERQVIAAAVHGRVAGLAVCDLSPCGWNLSGLGTAVQLFVVETSAAAVALPLLCAASHWFRARHATPWALLVNQSDIITSSACASCGLAPSRIYRRITVPIALAAAFTEGYATHITRGASIPAVASHYEPAVCI